jgi:uncharacterized protein YoxC
MSPLVMVTLDSLVIIALLVAIYYMRIVASAMTTIRQGKTEMQQVLKEMTLAINKAEDTIQGMKRLADDKGRALQKQMDNAQTLSDELKYINQSAYHLAQKLVKTSTPVMAAAKPKSEPPKASAPMSKAEKDLAAALQKRQAEK